MSKVLENSYRPSIQNSTINNTTYQTTGPRGFERLLQAVAPNAFHNSDDRPDPPKCHENTRVAVIEKIMDWVTGKIDTDAFMLWLYGPAGAGKSAIARTIAELCEARKLLLATFFFFRSDSKRNTVAPIVANIAYCVSRVIPGAREHIETVIDADPLILSCSLEAQLTKLVLEPLRLLSEQGHFAQTPIPQLIVIDGLDECLDTEVQTKLIRLLSSTAARCQLPLKFLIASRPEQHLKFEFAAVSPQSPVSRLELNNDFKPDQDIRLFLDAKFDDIKNFHPFSSNIPSVWPNEEQICALVRKASGQFIFASLAARFVNSPRHSPTQQLEIVLGLRPPIHHNLPFAELDALYTFIISSSDDPYLVLRILGIKAALSEEDVFQFHSFDEVQGIEEILGLEKNSVSIALGTLSSLLEVQGKESPDDAHQIIFHHSSFMDFICSPERSQNYCVDIQQSHTLIAQQVLQAFTINEPSASQPNLGGLHLTRHLTKSSLTIPLANALEKFSLGAYLDKNSQQSEQWAKQRLIIEFFNYLKTTANPKVHHHHFTLCLEHALSTIGSCASPEKFHLLSTVWFVLQKPLTSWLSTEYPSPWKKFCAMLFGFASPDMDWDANHYYLMVHPTTDNEARAPHNPLAGIYGHITETKRLVPDPILSRRLASIAISCTQYLRRRGPNTPPMQDHLRAWAMKSKRSPWLWSRRMQVASARGGHQIRLEFRARTRYSFPQSFRWLRQTLHSKAPQSEKFCRKARMMYIYALDLLYRTLRKARRSDKLTEVLSCPFIPWPAPLLFPRRVKRIRKAIEAYLDKFGPQASDSEVDDASVPSGFSSCEEEEYFSCLE